MNKEAQQTDKAFQNIFTAYMELVLFLEEYIQLNGEFDSEGNLKCPYMKAILQMMDHLSSTEEALAKTYSQEEQESTSVDQQYTVIRSVWEKMEIEQLLLRNSAIMSELNQNLSKEYEANLKAKT